MKTVIQVQGGTGRYGASRHTEQLLHGLAKREDWEAVVVCEPCDGHRFKDLDCCEVVWQDMSLRNGTVVEAAMKIREVVQERDIDLIHSHLRDADIVAGLASVITGVPLVVTLHGRTFGLSKQEGYLTKSVAKCHGWIVGMIAERVIAISRYIKRFCTEDLGVSEALVKVVYNATSGRDLGPRISKDKAKKRMGVTGDDAVVAQVGVGQQKGTADFLKIAKKVADSVGDVEYVLIGGAESMASYQKQALRRGIEGKCHFIGWRDDVGALLCGVDILLYTGKSEGFGRAITEAMRRSVPVVAYATGAVPEIVRDRCTGFLVGYGETETAAVKTVRLLKNPHLRKRMGEEGQRRAKERFSVDRFVEETIDVLNEVISNTKSQSV